MIDQASVLMKYTQAYNGHYDERRARLIKLADASGDRILDLERALATMRNVAPMCMQALRINTEKTIDIRRDNPAMISTQQFILHPIFTLWKPTMCGGIATDNNAQESVTCQCARNLAAGRCQDPFIRQTVGAILFPQFYAGNNQK